MPIKIKNKEDCLIPGTIIRGFGAKDTASVESLNLPGNIGIAKAGAKLLQEIARCGWNLPDINIECDGYRNSENHLYRYVSDVVFEFEDELIELHFSPSAVTGADDTPENYLRLVHRFPLGSDRSIGSESSAISDPEVILAIINGKTDELSKRPGIETTDQGTDEEDFDLGRHIYSEPIPASQLSPTLYTWIPNYLLDDAKRKSIASPNLRLLPLDIKVTGRGLHERVHDGFIYATTNPNNRTTNGLAYPDFETIPVEIKLKNFNEVYVIDFARHQEAMEELDRKKLEQGRKGHTNSEFLDVMTAIAATMTPIQNYKGNFRQPSYIIGRHLLKDEARYMTGPTQVVETENGVKSILIDEKSGRKISIKEYNDKNRLSMEECVRLSKDISRRLGSSYIQNISIDAKIAAERKALFVKMAEDKLKNGEQSSLFLDLLRP